MNLETLGLRYVSVLLAVLLLAACAPVEAPRLGAGPPVITPKQMGALGKPATPAADIVFALEPITNAPADMIYAFSDALKAQAPSRQIRLVDAGEPGASYRLKGYLSAVGDSNSTLLVYVWDVFDSNGARIHRLSGQVRGPGSAADPWAAMDETIVKKAASETIDSLGNWVHS
jgi:hypothetical protein